VAGFATPFSGSRAARRSSIVPLRGEEEKKKGKMEKVGLAGMVGFEREERKASNQSADRPSADRSATSLHVGGCLTD
jgi:hypothetical protein